VRFPDEVVFEESIKESDGEVIMGMLRRASVNIDVDRINMAGMTALHQAVLDNNLVVVRILIQHGAQVDKADVDSWTPLHASAANGHHHIAKYLISRGANKNALTDEGERPLDLVDPSDQVTLEVLLGEEDKGERDRRMSLVIERGEPAWFRRESIRDELRRESFNNIRARKGSMWNSNALDEEDEASSSNDEDNPPSSAATASAASLLHYSLTGGSGSSSSSGLGGSGRRSVLAPDMRKLTSSMSRCQFASTLSKQQMLPTSVDRPAGGGISAYSSSAAAGMTKHYTTPLHASAGNSKPLTTTSRLAAAALASSKHPITPTTSTLQLPPTAPASLLTTSTTTNSGTPTVVTNTNPSKSVSSLSKLYTTESANSGAKTLHQSPPGAASVLHAKQITKPVVASSVAKLWPVATSLHSNNSPGSSRRTSGGVESKDGDTTPSLQTVKDKNNRYLSPHSSRTASPVVSPETVRRSKKVSTNNSAQSSLKAVPNTSDDTSSSSDARRKFDNIRHRLDAPPAKSSIPAEKVSLSSPKTKTTTSTVKKAANLFSSMNSSSSSVRDKSPHTVSPLALAKQRQAASPNRSGNGSGKNSPLMPASPTIVVRAVSRVTEPAVAAVVVKPPMEDDVENLLENWRKKRIEKRER